MKNKLNNNRECETEGCKNKVKTSKHRYCDDCGNKRHKEQNKRHYDREGEFLYNMF